MAGVVTATGLLGTWGWGSALGSLGGFGGQGLLVLRHFRSRFLSPADRFSFPGDALLLLPCSLRSLPGSRKFFSIMSHMETLIVAIDGYSLGFSSSSIPSGRSPSRGLSGRVQTLQRLCWKRKANPSTRSRDAAQIVPREAGWARTGVVWRATPPMDSTTPVTPALLPAQGKRRATSRGRECGGNKRGGKPAAPEPANH